MRYKTLWVKQRVTDHNPVTECMDVGRVVAEYAEDGWALHSLVPGTNAQTYSGLFVTFQRVT